LETVNLQKIDEKLLEQIFNFMIRDFSKFAMQLYSKTSSTAIQKRICKRMIFKPKRDDEIFNSIYSNHVLALVEKYKMKN